MVTLFILLLSWLLFSYLNNQISYLFQITMIIMFYFMGNFIKLMLVYKILFKVV
jgi:hypothetical protein